MEENKVVEAEVVEETENIEKEETKVKESIFTKGKNFIVHNKKKIGIGAGLTLVGALGFVLGHKCSDCEETDDEYVEGVEDEAMSDLDSSDSEEEN